MQSSALIDRNQIVRFGIVGLANTACGYAVIVALLAGGAGDVVANICGYTVGLILSFFLNRRWTFRDAGTVGRLSTALRFFMVFAVAYATNLSIVLAFASLGYSEQPLVHLAGVAVYTTVFYFGSALLVFRPARDGGNAIATRYWPELVVLSSVIVASVAIYRLPLSHDAVWQMWIARQMIGGTTLYGGILELNPPLWFWLAVPVEKAAQQFGITSTTALIWFVQLLSAASLLACAALMSGKTSGRRLALLLAAGIALIVIPIPYFAQREHVALIGALPYLLLAHRRAEGSAVSARSAVAVGLLASLAFALKHYFVMVPILLEIWLICRLRRKWTPVRPELIILALCAVAYAAAVLVFAPEFITQIVPMLELAYHGYDKPFLFQVLRSFVLIWVVALPALAISAWFTRSALQTAAVLTAVGFVAAYFIQGKGFPYHSLPATGVMFFGLAAGLGIARPSIRHALSTVATVAILGLMLFFVIWWGPYENRNSAAVNELLRPLPPASTVLMITANPSKVWPMVTEAGHNWPSRHFAFWMLNAIQMELSERGRLSPDLLLLANRVREQTVEDMVCNPPDLIMVDDMSRSLAAGMDAAAFFSENEDFRKLFAEYAKSGAAETYTAYKRRGRLPDAAFPERCRMLH